MTLEKIINGIKKAACITLATIALAGIKEGRAQETNFGYEIIKIEVPDNSYSEAVGINNLGEVVGNSIYHSGHSITKYIPFLYTNGAAQFIVPDKFKEIFGEDFSAEAVGINDERRMLINAGAKQFPIHPIHDRSFIYNLNNGELIELPFKGVAINNRGEVVGKRHLLRNGQVIDIGLSPVFDCREPLLDVTIYGINENTQIVGEVILEKEDSNWPFIWENGLIYLLQRNPWYVYNPSFCFASSINNKGQIAGCLGYDRGEYYNFFSCKWVEYEVTYPGPKKNIEQLDSFNSIANAINEEEQIVGSRYGAILYQKGRIINLNDFLLENSGFWYLLRAIDINNEGLIVGDGWPGKLGLPTPPLERYYKYFSSPFLAKPLKEPSADINKDGIVNLCDLSELAEHWLEER